MKFSTVLSTLALTAGAFAASDSQDTTSLQTTLASTTSISVASGCSFSDAFTATAQSDLDQLAGCQAVQGDIIINGDLGSAAIANVKAIYGDLQIFNATNLQSFTADSVTTITGSLKLHGLTVLATLSFAQLSTVGAINWVTLPNLVSTGLTSVTNCNSIYISDTMLSDLKGINPTNVEIFNINNNVNLGSISSNIETVSNALSVAFNGDETIVEFDELVWANNLTFYSVASISMASIQAVNKSAGFFESSVTDLEFPLITAIGGDLTIENNDNLGHIDFSNVTSIGGGLVIANNTELLAIENIDSIKTVQGAVVLKGDFDNCTMSSLKTVRGSFDLETSGHADCTPFKSLSKNGGIQGSFVCKSKAVSSSSSTKTSKSTSTDSSNATKTTTTSSGDSTSTSVSSISSTSKAGASSRVVSVFGTLAAFVLALL